MESGLLFYKGYGKLRPMTGIKYGYFLYDNSKLQILGLKTNIFYEVLYRKYRKNRKYEIGALF